MKVGIYTLGCKVNQYESHSIMARLSELGFDTTEQLVPADYYIINTCSVTGEADRKSRQMVSRAQRANKDAKIIVTGCSSQNNPEAYMDKNNVICISGTANKIVEIEKVLLNGAGGMQIPDGGEADRYLSGRIYEEIPSPMTSRKRIHLKIQDGCDNFCSYCIVPYLRGRSRSRDMESIREEALAAAGKTKEIVLTGINISAYGKDTGGSLRELIMLLTDIPVRKRLGSLECGVIDDELLSALAAGDYCRHFHLSLQSGCDEVLRKMNRHYTAREFLSKIELIRSYFPLAGITTDIIAGFPGEIDENHRETMQFVEAAEFSDIHVFPYSARKGTAAAGLPATPPEKITERAKELTGLKEIYKSRFLEKNLGERHRVLIEESDDGWNTGYTDNYIKVYSHAPIGSFLSHRMKKIINFKGIEGEPDGE